MTRKVTGTILIVFLALSLLGLGVGPSHAACKVLCAMRYGSHSAHRTASAEVTLEERESQENVRTVPCDVKPGGHPCMLARRRLGLPEHEEPSLLAWAVLPAEIAYPSVSLSPVSHREVAVLKAPPGPLYIRNMALLF
ncbi:MAG: hypothetical protein GTN81_07080 [Proteobacteria bacterium]|nr:hypothetical protein [Pseudomonadota bacterium]